MLKIISTSEAARLLGISRVAVFKKIKTGELKAVKVGRNYVINRDDIVDLPDRKDISPKQKKIIQKALKKTLKDYGETMRLLKDA